MPRIVASLLLALLTLAPGPLPTSAAKADGNGVGGGASWTWPLDPIPRVIRGFEPPSSPYGPGHRGVDLAGSVGQPVLAIGDGTVTFAGSLAGRGVVVVDHGLLRSTYQPLTALVSVGEPVRAGEPIGFLQLPHSHCLPADCLHLGVRRGDVYIDPLRLLGPRPVRLKPLGDAADPTPPRGYGGEQARGGGGSRPAGSPWPLDALELAGLQAGLAAGR